MKLKPRTDRTKPAPSPRQPALAKSQRASGSGRRARAHAPGAIHAGGTLKPRAAKRRKAPATGRKRAETVRESEDKFRKLHESMRDAFVSVDMRGRILEFNSAYQEMLGYSAAELRARTYQSLTPRKWHAMEARIVAEEVIPSGFSGVYEKEYRRKDGTVFPIEVRAFLIRDAAGGPASMWAIVRDITERKRTEAALSQLNATLEQQVAERTAELRRSEERYRQLIQSLPVGLYTLDARGRITYYNAAAVKLWGREPKIGVERLGGALRLYSPDGRPIPRSRSPVAVAMRQGEPIRDAELIIERPDGTRSHVLGFPDPIHDSAGAVVGAVNVFVDITALKAAEKALHTSQRNMLKLSRVVEQSPTSVLITDPGGNIEYVNPRFTEVTGYSQEEVLGKNPRILKSNANPPELYRDMWRTITAGRVWRSPICNRRKNGELYWEFAVIAPIEDEHGAVTHYVAIKEDITERRRAAAEIQESAGRLRAILDTVRDAIVTIDRHGIITGTNPATERIFGYTGAEMLGKNVSMLMPSPYPEEYDGYIDSYLRTGKARVIGIGRDVQARRKDGTIFPIELAVSVVEHMDLFTGVIRDTTVRKRLEAEVLRIAEDERLRVAADLHDGICQELVGAQFIAAALRQDLEKARHPLAASAFRIEDAIRRTAEHTRQVARGMNPVFADASGLTHALRRLAEMTSLRGVHCVFQCPRPVTIGNVTVANELHRIAQEAVLNAVRHSAARRITIQLTTAGEEICLCILDNGRGLPPDVSGAVGMGLRVMRYRAGVIGGHFLLASRKPSGTAVVCRVANPRP